MILENIKKVLVVDDNPINLKVATRVLQNLGIKGALGNNGEQCLKILKQADFDLVLLDINMPVLDGYQTLKEIKTNINYINGKMKVIMLSAHDSARDMIYAKNQGAHGYIIKPFSQDNFLSTIDSI